MCAVDWEVYDSMYWLWWINMLDMSKLPTSKRAFEEDIVCCKR